MNKTESSGKTAPLQLFTDDNLIVNNWDPYLYFFEDFGEFKFDEHFE